MKTERIPLFDLTLSKRAFQEVNDTLRSGWLTTGPKVKAFEKAVAEYLGVKQAAAVSSATMGLRVSLQNVGAGAGTEVITTPFTFVATIEAVLRCGATPVLADIDPETLNIDPDEVQRKITSKTICIMPVDIAGQPVEYDRLKHISAEHSVPLIADASHAFGATYRGKSIPKLADAAVYSFHATKNLTCGEGGMVVSRHKALIDRVRLYSQHAVSSAAYQRRKSGTWEYDVSQLGFKANLSDVHASIGLGQLAVFDKNQTKRTRIAQRYISNLSDLGEYLEVPMEQKKTKHAWHLFIIRLHLSRLRIDRHRFIALMAEAGVECGVHFRPVFELSFYRESGLSPQHFPNATWAGRRVVSLPMFPGLKLSQVDSVCDRIEAIVKRHAR